MLAGNETLELTSLLIHAIHGLFKVLLPLRVVHIVAQDVDVEVAVARMAEALDADAHILTHLMHIFNERVDAVTRHNAVDLVHLRRRTLDRLKERTARLPNRRLALFRIGDEEIDRALVEADLRDVVVVARDLLRRVAVELQQQIGICRLVGELHAEELFGVHDDFALHELDGRRDDLRAHDDGYRIDRMLQGRERHEQRDRLLRQRDELQRRLRDDAERTFRADDHILDVVARRVLDDLAAEVHDRAVRHDDFQSAHIVARDAVLDGAHAAGVRRDVAADRRGLFAWIRRIEEPMRLNIRIDIHDEHARLDRQREVLVIELKEVVHERRIDHDALVHGDGCTNESRAGAARRHRQVVVVAILHDLGNFFRREHAHDDVRIVRLGAQFVMAVLFLDLVLPKKALTVNDLGKSLQVFFLESLVVTHATTASPFLIFSISCGTIS